MAAAQRRCWPRRAAGTLVLGGANAYSAGTALDQGVLNFANGTLPHGASSIHFYGGTLQWATGNTQDISAGIAPIANGQTAILDTNGNNVSFATGLSGGGGLTKTGMGMLVLAGSSGYSGGTTILAGVLQAGAGNALSVNSPVTISGGTLDASGFANTVNSLTIASGGLNLGLGNTLTCSGAAVLAGNLNVAGTGGAGNYQLLTYTSESGSFASTTLDASYGLLYKTTELDAEHKAQLGALTVTVANATVITGGTTALAVNVTNSAPSASDALDFTALVGGSGYGGSTTGSLAAASSGDFTITNAFNSTSLSAGSYTGTVTVTGTNSALGGLALDSGGTQTVTVNVLDHAAGSVTVTSGNGFLAHAGTSGLSATIAVGNAAGTRSDLEVDSAPSISQGALSGGPATPYYVSAGSAQTYTATFDAGNTPGAFSNTVTLVSAGDNQSLPGANPPGLLAVSITGNVYSGKAQWNAAGGSWGTSGNWMDAVGGGPSGAPGVSGYATDTATFGATASGGSAAVTLDSAAPVLSNLVFSNSNASWVIQPGTGNSALSLTGTDAGSPAAVTVICGTHYVQVPVVLESNLIVSSSGSLEIDGNISDGGLARSLTLDGGGTLVLAGTNSYGGGTLVNAGTLVLASGSALADGTSLTIGDGGEFASDPSAGASPIASSPTSPVPEPGTVALLAAGLVGGFAAWRKRKGTGHLFP